MDWTQYKWLADWCTARNTTTLHGYSTEDLRQDAVFRLWRMSKRVDPTKGSVRCYFRRGIEWELQRSRQRNGHVTSWTTSEPCQRAAVAAAQSEDTAEARAWSCAKAAPLELQPWHQTANRDDDERIDRQRLCARVLALLASEPERTRTIIRRRYVDDMTLAEVGAELGLSHERVRQIEAKAFARVRRMIGADR